MRESTNTNSILSRKTVECHRVVSLAVVECNKPTHKPPHIGIEYDAIDASDIEKVASLYVRIEPQIPRSRPKIDIPDLQFKPLLDAFDQIINDLLGNTEPTLADIIEASVLEPTTNNNSTNQTPVKTSQNESTNEENTQSLNKATENKGEEDDEMDEESNDGGEEEEEDNEDAQGEEIQPEEESEVEEDEQDDELLADKDTQANPSSVPSTQEDPQETRKRKLEEQEEELDEEPVRKSMTQTILASEILKTLLFDLQQKLELHIYSLDEKTRQLSLKSMIKSMDHTVDSLFSLVHEQVTKILNIDSTTFIATTSNNNTAELSLDPSSTTSQTNITDAVNEYLKSFQESFSTFDVQYTLARKENMDRMKRRWEGLCGTRYPIHCGDRFNLKDIPLACERIPNPFGR